MFTVMAYLSDGYQGGALRFNDGEDGSYFARAGDLVLLDMREGHQAMPVQGNVMKYILRSDLFFRRSSAPTTAPDVVAATALFQQGMEARSKAQVDAAFAQCPRLSDLFFNMD